MSITYESLPFFRIIGFIGGMIFIDGILLFFKNNRTRKDNFILNCSSDTFRFWNIHVKE